MTTEEIKQGNELIAKFMGYINTTPTDPDFNIYQDVNGNMLETMSMKYHNSWDWIMPVVKRINEICHADDGEEFFCSDEYTSILDVVPLADIESSYRVVLEFIKWYNENK